MNHKSLQWITPAHATHFLTWDFLFTNVAKTCTTSMMPMQVPTTPTAQTPIWWAKYFSHTFNDPQMVWYTFWDSSLELQDASELLLPTAPHQKPPSPDNHPPHGPVWAPTGCLCFHWIYCTIWCYSHMWNAALNTFWICPVKDQIQRIHENNL